MAQSLQTVIAKNTKYKEALPRVVNGFESPLTAQGMNTKRYRSFAALLGRDQEGNLKKSYENTTWKGRIAGEPRVGDAYEVAIWDDRKGRPYASKSFVVSGVTDQEVEVLVVKGPATAEKTGAMMRIGSAHSRVAAVQAIRVVEEMIAA